jgi:3-methyladenine DNA glycosylase AlkD
MTADEIVAELRSLGSEATKKVLARHGIQEPFFGTKVEDLKKVQKRIKTNHPLALALYDTGIYDAMYLAGLIADDSKFTKKDLNRWATKANCPSLSEYTVAWVASGSPLGREMAREWIDSKKESIASSGWSTWGSLVSITADDQLDLGELTALLGRVRDTIHTQPNRVRHTMNCFIIQAGSYVSGLTDLALQTAAKVGKVSVNMGETACKVPDATEYIKKVQARGSIGKKRKTAKC